MTGGIHTIRAAPETLRERAEAILVSYGATEEEAAIQADEPLQGELRGHRSRALAENRNVAFSLDARESGEA